jgi:hypothetical protein
MIKRKYGLILLIIVIIAYNIFPPNNSDKSNSKFDESNSKFEETNSKFDEIAIRWMDARNPSPSITTGMKDACAWQQIYKNDLNGSFRIDDSILGGPFDRKEMYDKLDKIFIQLKIELNVSC